MVVFLLFVGLAILLLGLFICGLRLFNYLLILEGLKVLLLISSLMLCSEESRILFLSLMCIFVLEVSIMLIVASFRMCGRSLLDIVGH